MSFKKFVKELSGDRVEGQLVKTLVVSLLTVAIAFSILYFAFLNQYLNLTKNGLFIFLALLSIALIGPTIHQVRAYRSLSCMGGMMVGMTCGMISGFLIGFYVGATNGVFIGSLTGMAAGIFIGIWLGLSCGVMGFLEGIMAGFMGGMMGAMTAIMAFNDGLRPLAVICFAISAIILIGLKYMIYKESLETKDKPKFSYLSIIIPSAILSTLVLLVISFAPKSIIVQ